MALLYFHSALSLSTLRLKCHCSLFLFCHFLFSLHAVTLHYSHSVIVFCHSTLTLPVTQYCHSTLILYSHSLPRSVPLFVLYTSTSPEFHLVLGSGIMAKPQYRMVSRADLYKVLFKTSPDSQ